MVGRVNVGKSTLFNKVTETTQALVSSVPGTTRTRNVAHAWWRGVPLKLVDTGGLTFDDTVTLEKEIIKQTEIAIKEADLILFVVDVLTGVLPQERELAKRLRKLKKPVILVGNKADSPKKEQGAYSGGWQALGFGDPLLISAASGRRVGDLLDEVYDALPKPNIDDFNEEDAIKVALIGKPNVGKSSLFNALVGEDRVIVSPMAHTTREPHDTLVVWDGQPIKFIDTAGIRRPARMKAGLEKEGVKKSLKTLTKADIALLVVDSTDDLSAQEKRLASELEENAVGTIIVINKWDTVEGGSSAPARNAARQQLQGHFPFATHAPITFTSALNKKGIHTLLPLIKKVDAARKRELTEEELAEFFRDVLRKHKPSRGKGTKHPRLTSFTQIDTNPPVFELRVKSNTSLHRSYVNYLKNQLRKQFDFTGAPIIIKLRKNRTSHSS